MLILFDSHCHLAATEFDSDRDAVIASAKAAGVMQQLIPAVDYASWQTIKHICVQHSGLLPAYGLHPMYLDQHRPEHLSQLEQWLTTEQPAAVGECGLDFFVEGLDPIAQRYYFEAQLLLAKQFNLPVVIHARKSLDEVIKLLRVANVDQGVVHSFSGSPQQAEQLFELGFMLGIGAVISFDRAKRLRQLVSTMPIKFLLLETDAPDQPGALHRGERNQPAYLPEVANCISQLRGESIEYIAEHTTANARKLFIRSHL